MTAITMMTGRQLHAAFMTGELTAEEIITAHLERIDAIDEQVGAFLTVYHERALAHARNQDSRKTAGETMGSLAGVPIGIKDNIHVEGELTTCASKFLANYRAPFAATAVRLLEEADAIVIGKLNCDEFAMGSGNEHSAFYPCRNPWNLKKVPGGSSGGSAAAVAAQMCPISLGTDTGGSIRQPAAFCGITGFKPTYGRVSRYGLVAFGSSLDQIGPLARSVDDIAMVMEVMGAHCEYDSTSLAAPTEKYIPDHLAGKKIGVPRSFLGDLSDEASQIFDSALKTATDLGAELVDIDLNLLKYSVATYYVLANAEASTNLARFDGVRFGVRAKASTLDEVYDLSRKEGFGDEVKRRIMLGTYVLSAGYQDAYYHKAQKVRAMVIERFSQAFKQCDLVAMPTAPTTAFDIGGIKDPVQTYLQDIYTICANLAGLPAISIPSGISADNLPYGLQLIGPQRNDVAVCSAAAALAAAHPVTLTTAM